MANKTATRKASGGAARKLPDTIGINVALPTALHRKVRVKAVNEGLTLAEALEAALKDWVR